MSGTGTATASFIAHSPNENKNVSYAVGSWN